MVIEGITLGDVSLAVAFLTALIGGISVLHRNLKKGMSALMKDELDPLKADIKSIRKDLETVDMETCKNYLVRFLADVEQGKVIDEIEMQRFWEQYDHYEKHGGNSYIHQKVEKLRAKNYL